MPGPSGSSLLTYLDYLIKALRLLGLLTTWTIIVEYIMPFAHDCAWEFVIGIASCTSVHNITVLPRWAWLANVLHVGT